MPPSGPTFPIACRMIENLFIPLPDGTRLAAKVWRPEGAGPVPAILEYLPYRKRDGTRTRDDGHARLSRRAWLCLSARRHSRHGRQRGADRTTNTREQEQVDGCDVIGWIAAQDWCDGQVAMIGISWGGFNGLQIAARQPPALKTVITVGSTDDRYATDVHWIGGCLSKDNFDWSSTMFAQNDLPPDPAIVGAALARDVAAADGAQPAVDPRLAAPSAPRRLTGSTARSARISRRSRCRSMPSRAGPTIIPKPCRACWPGCPGRAWA